MYCHIYDYTFLIRTPRRWMDNWPIIINRKERTSDRDAEGLGGPVLPIQCGVRKDGEAPAGSSHGRALTTAALRELPSCLSIDEGHKNSLQKVLFLLSKWVIVVHLLIT